jgi:haloalkane dehalogenase
MINRLTYFNQIAKFIKNEDRRKSLVPKLYKPFSDPLNFRAFLKLNKDLDNAIARNRRRVPEMAKLDGKTHIIFGAEDPYLNVNVAKQFNKMIPGSTLDIIADASHYVQVDQPEQVAGILITLIASP